MKKLGGIIPISSEISNLTHVLNTVSQAISYDLELILVIDEVSTKPNKPLDSLIRDLQSTPSNLEIVKGEFGGPGHARNAGLQLAHSEYICFWDADDDVVLHGIVQGIHETENDFIFGSYVKINMSTGENEQRIPRSKLDLILEPAIWRAVFRREALPENPFGISRVGEDQVFLARSGVLESNSISFSPRLFYTYYYNRSGQITSEAHLNRSIIRSIREITQTKSRNFTGLTLKLLLIGRLISTLQLRIIRGLK